MITREFVARRASDAIEMYLQCEVHESDGNLI